jgi:dTDP-4-dehydrorhamnose 3,5-epimerase
VTFTPLALPGAFLIEAERHEDARGFFARTFCRREFEAHGLTPVVAQCNVSWNARRGTIRGLHWQAAPGAEAKLVRCIRGAVFDVIVDVRPGSAAFGRWIGVSLEADDTRMIYAPEGVAHGFQTIVDATELFYQMSASHDPALERGLRWNDPALAIGWPLGDVTISPRDAALPLLADL